MLAHRVPPAARGRAFAPLVAAVQPSMVGYLAGGVLLEHFAPRPLVAAAGLLLVAGRLHPFIPARRTPGTRDRPVPGAPAMEEVVDGGSAATQSAGA
jgi:hypothetical protein